MLGRGRPFAREVRFLFAFALFTSPISQTLHRGTFLLNRKYIFTGPSRRKNGRWKRTNSPDFTAPKAKCSLGTAYKLTADLKGAPAPSVVNGPPVARKKALSSQSLVDAVSGK